MRGYYQPIYYYSLCDFLRKEFTGDYDALKVTEADYFVKGEYIALTYALYAANALSYASFKENYAGLCDVLNSKEAKTLVSDYILPNSGKDNIAVSYSDTEEKNPVIKEIIIKVSGWLVRTYPYYKKMIDLYSAEENSLMDAVKTTSKTNGNAIDKTTSKATGSSTDTANGSNSGTSSDARNSKTATSSTSKKGYSDMPQTATFDEAPATDVLSNLTNDETGGSTDVESASNGTTSNTSQSTTTNSSETNSEIEGEIENESTTESTNELNTKINRLKEIREEYANIYNLWFKDFEKQFIIY